MSLIPSIFQYYYIAHQCHAQGHQIFCPFAYHLQCVHPPQNNSHSLASCHSKKDPCLYQKLQQLKHPQRLRSFSLGRRLTTLVGY
uniref:DNA repair protein REV1 n=1 Tax=Rhizophora mucronata TaxID=61149 RepID=A0A2P2KDI0_RHIMU